jgi:hypothetical protein
VPRRPGLSCEDRTAGSEHKSRRPPRISKKLRRLASWLSQQVDLKLETGEAWMPRVPYSGPVRGRPWPAARGFRVRNPWHPAIRSNIAGVFTGFDLRSVGSSVTRETGMSPCPPLRVTRVWHWLGAWLILRRDPRSYLGLSRPLTLDVMRMRPADSIPPLRHEVTS